MKEKWHEKAMRQVYLVASMSPDKRTKIGAVLVKGKRPISEGFNGPPYGVYDDIEDRHQSPEKYFWYEHAERNSIYGCAELGISSKDSTLYLNTFPCSDCARSIIQGRIKEIYIHKQYSDLHKQTNLQKWEESFKRSAQMLKETNIKVIYFDKVLEIEAYLDGKIVKV